MAKVTTSTFLDKVMASNFIFLGRKLTLVSKTISKHMGEVICAVSLKKSLTYGNISSNRHHFFSKTTHRQYGLKFFQIIICS